MKPYTKQDIEIVYGDIIRSAYRNYAKSRIKEALKDIATASRWAYEFNHIYTDSDADQLLKKISEACIDAIRIDEPRADHCVMINSFLCDNRGLSQQYLRAMMSQNMQILVVHTKRGGRVEEYKDTMAELYAYGKAKIISYDKRIDVIEQARKIVAEIDSFSPANIFFHLAPWDVVALIACSAVNGAKKYNINLTDHAFWLGASFFDHNLEFRPYGMTVSLEKRGIEKDKELALPYYPITPMSSEFVGLPITPDNAIKVLTGGAIYKMLGKDDIFFKMMERILSISPNVYILVAGFDKNSYFEEKITKLSGGERIQLIGVRNDIDAVFEHCDIYLGTYPISGGLMTQYAAKHALPVIAYHEEGDVMNAIEEVLNYYQNDFKSFTDLEKFTLYSERLIKSEDFRKSQGKLLKDGMMDEKRFNYEFANILINHTTSFEWRLDDIDYEAFFETYLDMENINGFMATRHLVSSFKIQSVSKVTVCRTNMVEEIFNKIARRFKTFVS